jgi:hypothetical protein
VTADEPRGRMVAEGVCTGVRLDKRTNLPGIVLRGVCPACGEPCEIDMAEDDLRYPVVGERKEMKAYCECGAEWTFGVIVRLSLEVVP